MTDHELSGRVLSDDLLARLSNLDDDSRAVLEEMTGEYDRAMEDERRFRDRPTAADRTAAYRWPW